MKKVFISFLLLLLTSSSLQAQTTSILTFPHRTPTTTDAFYVVIPPGGASNQRQSTLQELFNGSINLTAKTLPISADSVILYDSATNIAKITSLSNLSKSISLESGLTTDVTTLNSSTSKHGFLPKLDNTTTHYMDGTGAWSAIPDAGAATTGLVTTGTQTFIGAKTFTGNIITPIISGSAAASGNLTLQSTTDSTKGFIILGSGGLVGINKATSVGAQLHIVSASASVIGQIIQLASTPTGNAMEVNSSAGSGGDLFRINSSGSIATVGSILLSTGGTVMTTTGDISSGHDVIAAAARYFYFSGRSTIASPADGVILFQNNANSDFTSFKLGGTTSSFPSIKRNSTAINIRLADDSADAPLTAGATTIGGGTAIGKVMSATATLDFGSTAAGAGSDLIITVTGAAVGDIVNLGVPNGSVTTTGTYFGWVSATNTVTVRFTDNALVGSEDPASGLFRAMVTHF